MPSPIVLFCSEVLASLWRRAGAVLAPGKSNGAIALAADIVGNFDELAEGGALARDPGAPRRRLVSDGYLFLRCLLPAA